jgi:Protein of unknown function (DUF1570)
MKRGLLAGAALLGLTLSTARADYVILVANANEEVTAVPAAQMGAQGAAGARGAVGGQVGFAGAMGIQGGQAGVAGAMGAAGGGGLLGRPGQLLGQFGALGGQTGARGGAPMGFMGGTPMGFMGGTPMGAGAEGAVGGAGGQAKVPPVIVMTVLEVKNRVAQQKVAVGGRLPSLVIPIYHKWGASYLWGPNIRVIPVPGRDGHPLPPVEKRFENEYRNVTKLRNASAPRYLDTARWALDHGLIAEFEKVMEDLAKAHKGDERAAAFQKVKANLARPLSGEGPVSEWKRKLFRNSRVATSPHYSLLHTAPSNESEEVKSRLRRLEENMTGFYYWHALQGKVLPMPHERLLAVLVAGSDLQKEFQEYNSQFDFLPVTADSFYSARHNLVVFAGRRLDEPYDAVIRTTEPLFKVYALDTVFKHKQPAANFDLLAAQTAGVLIKSLNEDGEIAAVSHSGTRQLLVATGLLAGNVDLPQWVQSGVGSMFQTPYASPWKSYGAPHWSYLLAFGELQKEKQLGDAHKLLRDVITDKFFRQGLPRLKAAQDRKAGENRKRTEVSVKARATAWALVHYLAHKKLDNLMAYYKELSRLPRDLPLDNDVLLDCFARAFGFVDRDNKRKDAELDRLASSWLSYMNNEVILDNEALPIYVTIYKLQNELKKELARTNKPIFPRLPGGVVRPGGP